MSQKNISTFLSFAFLIVIICSALLPVLGLRNNVSVSSHGTVNYPELPPPTQPTPSPSPQPTPSPSPYIGTNLAPLNTWKGSNGWAPCYWEENAFNGKPAWRNEGVVPYKTREMNSRWIAVKPGDRLVLSAWMKAEPSNLGTNSIDQPQSGARIGLDWYTNDGGIRDPNGWISGVVCNPGGTEPVYPPPTQGIVDNFVGWGSDWSFRVIDCIVPSTVYGKTPTGVVLWFAALTNRMYGDRWQGELAPVWLSETEFYINPT